MVAFAAKAGSTASDGGANNSPFATALVDHLAKPGLDLRKAFGFVRDDVLKATNNAQEPFVYGSLGGNDVSLVPAAPVASAAVDHDVTMRRDYELALQISTKPVWDSFVSKYPTGFYTDLAKAQRDKLAAEAARVDATNKAKAAQDEQTRLAIEGAKGAEQTRAAEQAKATERARVAAEKAKKAEEAKVVEAERAKSSAIAKAAEKEAERAKAAEQPKAAAEAKKNASEKTRVDVRTANIEPTRARSEPTTPKPKAALEGDARCNKMRDKLGCLCAVRNGGGISTDGRSWYSKSGGRSAPTNEAFVQCQLRAGRG
jgi:hypothetical protein